MKPKLIRILFAFSLATFLLVGYEQLHAQDSSTSETYEGDDEKDKEPIFSPGEQADRPFKIQSSTPLKDSAAFAPKTISASQPRATKPSPESAKPETKQSSSDDSILSFNFLYYIIQKYKLQDIVD